MIKKGKYKHYKGHDYQVFDVVRHSETEEVLVLYKPLYGDEDQNAENEVGNLWVRPLLMFTEMVVVDGKEVPRFGFVGEIDEK